MGKHAYCILAHNDAYCLKSLTRLLDDPRNDIFIHLDSKCGNAILEDIHLIFSNLITPPLSD